MESYKHMLYTSFATHKFHGLSLTLFLPYIIFIANKSDNIFNTLLVKFK